MIHSKIGALSSPAEASYYSYYTPMLNEIEKSMMILNLQYVFPKNPIAAKTIKIATFFLILSVNKSGIWLNSVSRVLDHTLSISIVCN